MSDINGTTTVNPTYVLLSSRAMLWNPKLFAIDNTLYKIVLPKNPSAPAFLDSLPYSKKSVLNTMVEKLNNLIIKGVEENIIEVKELNYENDKWSDQIIELAYSFAEKNKNILVVADGFELLSIKIKLTWLSILETIINVNGSKLHTSISLALIHLFSYKPKNTSIIKNIKVIPSEDYIKLLNKSESRINTELMKLAQDIKKEQGYVSIKQLGPPLIIFLGLIALLLKFTEAFPFLFRLNIWVAVLIVFVFGVFLYWYRSKYRLFYGILETIFGIVISSTVISSNFDYSKFSTTEYIQLFSGIYVVIRGLDNVEKGLEHTDSEMFKDLWGRYFGPPKRRI